VPFVSTNEAGYNAVVKLKDLKARRDRASFNELRAYSKRVSSWGL